MKAEKLTKEEQETINKAHEIVKKTHNKQIVLLIKSTIDSIFSTIKSMDLIPEEERIILIDAISKYIQNLSIIIDVYENSRINVPLNTYLINPNTGYPYIIEHNKNPYSEHYNEILNTIHYNGELPVQLITKKGRIKYYEVENQNIKLYLAEYKGLIIIITATHNDFRPFNIDNYHNEIKKQYKEFNTRNQEIYNLLVESEFDLNYYYQKSSQYSKKDNL